MNKTEGEMQGREAKSEPVTKRRQRDNKCAQESSFSSQLTTQTKQNAERHRPSRCVDV